MTSNIGARLITEQQTKLGFTFDSSTNAEQKNIKDTVLAELKKLFKPEFLNRVDDIIVFSKLTEEDIKNIAQNMLTFLKDRLAAIDVNITFTDNAVSAIAKEGFDPIYGARPLRRVIRSKIEDSLSEKILDKTLNKPSNIICDFVDGKFVFS